jgi:hypothetical protein
MTTVVLDAVFMPFFKIVHDTGQQLTIDRTNFLTDGFLQIIQRTGFVSVTRPLHSDRVTAWCAVSPFGIIGPYFLEESGVTVTVNYARYIKIITHILRQELRRRRINCANV